jgi:hypothetical protein
MRRSCRGRSGGVTGPGGPSGNWRRRSRGQAGGGTHDQRPSGRRTCAGSTSCVTCDVAVLNEIPQSEPVHIALDQATPTMTCGKATLRRQENLPKSSPDGIRTRATALRGQRARPLHNGASSSRVGARGAWRPRNDSALRVAPIPHSPECGGAVSSVTRLRWGEPELTRPAASGPARPATQMRSRPCGARRWCSGHSLERPQQVGVAHPGPLLGHGAGGDLSAAVED